MELGFRNIHNFVSGILPDGLEWIAFSISGIFLALVVINALVGVAALYTWFERRVLGRFQSRLGPNRWGPFGLLQPLADIIKLITKEDISPNSADRIVSTLAPIALLVPAFLVFAIMPFGTNSFLGDLNVGVLFIMGVTGMNTFGIFMGGWGSRNKYAMLGAMRGVAMLVSYEVPMALALAGAVLLAGSLSLSGIVASQTLPFLIVQPLGFLVFIIAASAEMSRAPFDMIEAESELTGGYHTEFSGIKFAIFQLAEFMAPLVTAAILTVVFLGGSRGPDLIPGQVWFILKALAATFFLLWIRATWPRLRVDQIMGFAWKGLFPLALLNIFLIAGEIQFFQSGGIEPIGVSTLLIMSGINWLVTGIAIYILANVLGQPSLQPKKPVPSPLANMYAEAE